MICTRPTLFLLLWGPCSAFTADWAKATTQPMSTRCASADFEESSSSSTTTRKLPQNIASQFKILTCASTSCAKKRENLGMDEYSTFSAFYVKAQEMAPSMTVEESTCLGCCQAAPCVAIAHEEYEGTVSLEGMNPTEFSDRVFQNVLYEEDAERVWASIENAIHVLAAEEDNDNGEEKTSQGVEV